MFSREEESMAENLARSRESGRRGSGSRSGAVGNLNVGVGHAPARSAAGDPVDVDAELTSELADGGGGRRGGSTTGGRGRSGASRRSGDRNGR